jgi:4-hydroxy-3-polyprenylbenzoate decarboxylase
MGAVIMPPVLSFYNRPDNIEDITNHITGQILGCFGKEHEFRRWGEEFFFIRAIWHLTLAYKLIT